MIQLKEQQQANEETCSDISKLIVDHTRQLQYPIIIQLSRVRNRVEVTWQTHVDNTMLLYSPVMFVHYILFRRKLSVERHRHTHIDSSVKSIKVCHTYFC